MTTPSFVQIAAAANAEAMRYENPETALAQVRKIEQVCSFNGYRWFVVSGTVFRKVSSFNSYFVARTAPDGTIMVGSEYTFASAEQSAFADADRVRAKFDEREAV